MAKHVGPLLKQRSFNQLRSLRRKQSLSKDWGYRDLEVLRAPWPKNRKQGIVLMKYYRTYPYGAIVGKTL